MPLTEHQALVALNLTQGMGAVTARNLIAAFGSAAAVFDASPDELRTVRGIGAARGAQLAEDLAKADPVAEEARAERNNVRLIDWDDPDYPAALRRIYDPPLVLYVRGDAKALAATGVAIIGTRSPTHYGRETAFRLGYQLASVGYAVISGIARGIDTEGHRGAVQAKGRTVAVLGGALDRLYPHENIPLARDIVANGGAIITEYPFGREPDRQTFPMRNRIVSGLSAGVVVVEAASASGTLITVDQALEQGRAVMAVPGRIDTPTAQGCHKLIRNGATLVTCVDDVVEALQTMPIAPKGQAGPGTSRAPSTPLPAAAPPPAAVKPRGSLSPDEEKLVEALGSEERAIDELVDRSGLDAGRVNGLLVGLQIKRFVKLLPGGRVGPVA